MTAPAFDPIDAPLDGLQVVEASAGTGKTWALSALYLRLLLERGLEVQQILVTTFTKAATAELKDRLRQRIAELLRALEPGAEADTFARALLQRLRAPALALSDARIRQRLELALGSFDEATVYTLHGFCQRALELGAFSAGVPFTREAVADDADWRRQVVNDFWRRRIAGVALDPGFAAHWIAGRFTPDALAAELKRRVARPLAHYRWPPPPAPAAEGDPLPGLQRALRALWAGERAAVIAAVDAARPSLHAGHYTAAAVQEAAAAWDGVLAADSPHAADLDDGAAKRLTLFGRARLRAKKGAPAVPSLPFFDLAQAWLDARAAAGERHAAQRLARLRELLDAGPGALRALKRERRVIGYDDMLFELHQRLQADEDGRLAATLRARHAAALVDEFQDSDPLQVAILQRLFGDGAAPAFLVGDPKQAIYAFRNADLHTYLAARDAAGTVGTLRDNQRSTGELIRALNRLFGANPRAFVLDGLDYPVVAEGAKPRARLDDRSGVPRAALQLWRLPAGADGMPLRKRDALARAAAVCADEIVRLLADARRGTITLDGRALAPRDLAVLVRTRAHGRLVRQALAARGVGSADLEQTSIFATADARQLQQILHAVAEPTREPLLRAALATDPMGRDAAAIDALDADPAAQVSLVERFAGWHDRWHRHGVAWLLREWMRAEGVAPRLLARADGERRLTNLRHLAECLHEAEREHRAPEALLRWFDAQCAEPRDDEATQLRLESDRDLVQVVTIHRCKGLEYPFVFCPMLFDGSDGAADRGLAGVAYHDADGRACIDLGGDAAAQAQERLERRAEQLRLLYVALTRAVHRCHVPIGIYAQARGSTIESLRSALNWLAAGAGSDPAAWLAAKKPASAPIDAAWDALAAGSGGAIALEPCPAPTGARLPPLQPDPATLAALDPPPRIAAGFTLGSYSSLMHGARHDAAATDHDQRADTVPEVGAATGGPDGADGAGGRAGNAGDGDGDDIVHFPRGPAAGDCLHELFERVDFGAPDGWPAVVDAVLQRHAPALPADARAAQRPRMLLRLLADVLGSVLPGALRLAEVPARRRMAELEFHLPARALTAPALGALLQRHGAEAGRLEFRPLDGYLRGFVDLVFEHGGRWYLADWKSNHLGDTAAHYAPAALRAAMARHGYGLQALLYTLALHRHLARCVDGYDYTTHFGGAYYLFVRGLRPGWADADGRPCGVHRWRPDPALVDELSMLLDGAAAGR